MDDVWVRIGLVAGALLIVGVTTFALRRRAAGPPRSLAATGLAAGTYLFSSNGCPTCESARVKLVGRVGEAGFKEIVWERDAGLFSELGVDAVPAVLVVDHDGSGKLYPGQPGRALRVV